MAHSLKLVVIAEGVETAAQLRYLRQHNCDYIQVYYFSPPLAVPAMEKILRRKKRLEPLEGKADAPSAHFDRHANDVSLCPFKFSAKISRNS